MSKKQYPTAIQKKKLIELLEADEELRQGKFSGNFTKKVAEERWTAIAQEINSIGGANKIWSDWRKTWQDMKSKTKKKQAFIRRSTNLTGGGPPPPALTEEENLVLTTMTDVAVLGHGDSQESVVCFKDILGPRTTDPIVPPIAPNEACVDIEPITVIIESEEAIDLEDESVKATKSKKQKKTMAQKRLQKSINIADSLVEVLKEKNRIKKEYYDKKIIEMRKQSNALIAIANNLDK